MLACSFRKIWLHAPPCLRCTRSTACRPSRHPGCLHHLACSAHGCIGWYSSKLKVTQFENDRPSSLTGRGGEQEGERSVHVGVVKQAFLPPHKGCAGALRFSHVVLPCRA